MGPALYYGLHVLLGAALWLHPHWVYALIMPLLWYRIPWQRVVAGALLTFCMYGYTAVRAPPTWSPGLQSGYLSIHSVQPYSSPFQKSLLYRATFNQVPCLLYFDLNKTRPLADADYFAEGLLVNKEKGMPVLKLKGIPEKVPDSFRFAEKRFQMKEKLRAFLAKKIPDWRAAHFLSSLLTGDVDDRQLSMEFRQVGLSHLLAISGLDFALIAAFLGWGLRLLLPWRVADGFLLVLMTLFFLFLGVNPSILRAYTAIALFLVARLLDLQTQPLNLLGAALLVELLYDPLTLEHPGFQLSFLCTAGLLLFFKSFDQGLRRLFPKRPYEELCGLSVFDQHAALLAGWIRQACAATFAAHLLALPICLYHFHTFPLVSLLYNLFFPFGSAVSLLLCLISLLLGPLGAPLHLLNSHFTGFLLSMIASPPPLLKISLYVKTVPFALVLILVALFVTWGIDRKDRKSA